MEVRLHDAAGPHPHSQHVRLCGDVQGRDDAIHVLKETGGEGSKTFKTQQTSIFTALLRVKMIFESQNDYNLQNFPSCT